VQIRVATVTSKLASANEKIKNEFFKDKGINIFLGIPKFQELQNLLKFSKFFSQKKKSPSHGPLRHLVLFLSMQM
jgi:hypothetical protein